MKETSKVDTYMYYQASLIIVNLLIFCSEA
jgi:hypothetical protein